MVPLCLSSELLFGDEFLSQGLHVESVELSADQSSSSTLTESFLFDSCLIHRDTVMLE